MMLTVLKEGKVKTGEAFRIEEVQWTEGAS
jgi:hypothetical protein